MQKTQEKEKQLLEESLLLEKHLCSAYGEIMTEVTCPLLRETLKQCLTDAENNGYSILNFLKSKGYYEVKNASGEELSRVKERFRAIQNSL